MELYFFYAIAGLEFLLPIACILWLFIGRSRDIFAWFFRFITSALWFNVAFMGLPWAYTSMYLRWVFLAIFIVVAIFSYRRIIVKSLYVRKGFSYYLGMLYILISLTMALLLNVSVISGFFPAEGGREIASPLKGSDYVVIQGGNSGVTNVFHHYFKQRKHTYAMDIVRLRKWGNRAGGIAPDSLEAYQIYTDSLFCPCSGTVAAARAGIFNNKIGEVNSREILGNYIIMNCGDFFVTLAHLQPGSMKLQPGQKVKQGDFIGLAGNSGYSVEPHLHIEGYIVKDSAEVSIPLLINDRFLSINQKVK